MRPACDALGSTTGSKRSPPAAKPGRSPADAGAPDPIVRADVRPLARVCAYQRADGQRTDGHADSTHRSKGGSTITAEESADERRNRSIRTRKTRKVKNDQLKTSQDVPTANQARGRTVACRKTRSRQSMIRRELHVDEDLLARALAIIAADLVGDREQKERPDA
ncbi:hypothetical protein Ato02nite_074670 [Paractinoplanes toevensis]|uniref:Uncharacterized protein n=1 Tax=Paractinoplanes toevensis TaxID=571911 RepID=A0A919W5K2_9ACTN|nr:hypothetical protein Ato02nite_074670 [Actinoplanes toevensis]